MRRPGARLSGSTLRLAAAVLVATFSQQAGAHWCHDLWGSSYNVVVKPASDTVNVPAGSTATLDVYVQNNMGYPLINFALRATATGYTVSIQRQAPKVANFLMPGENLRHTLTVGSTAGGTLSVQSLNFYVDFGEGNQGSGQDMLYGGGTTGSRHAVMRTVAGSLRPARPVSIPAADGQALHLGASAKADYSDLAGGLDDLMGEFCAGRGSWDTNGGAPLTATYCSGTNTTCPALVTRGHTKYDYQHLWAAFELAYRKAALGARTAPLRARLMCATSDSSPSFKFFPFAMLGYLGEDATARTFLSNLIANGTADEKAAAKSALMLFGSAADGTAYRADVTAALSSTNQYVQMLAATTLGIVDGNDAAVAAKLIPRSGWVEPDTSDNGLNFFAAHLLNLVAWNRRSWASDANYSGSVSFYSTVVDTTPPRAPEGIACVAQANGTVRVTWSAVTLDTGGAAETLQGYRVYRGTTTRPAGVTRPGELSFDYDHLDPATALFLNAASLSGTQPHYFTVTALDAAGNASVYGSEVSCLPRYAPVAVLTCDQTSGTAPLTVTCTSSASSDANGAADITARAWRLDGVAQPAGTTFSTTFAGAGNHVIQLTVTDSTAQASSASANVSVTGGGGSTSDGGSNSAPTAAAAAAPSSGAVPLTVAFSSAGSSDPDVGQTLRYSWNFDDNSAPSTVANPSHGFNSAGVYDVVLTVTDDGTPPASGSAGVRVTVTGNSPPDLSSVSAAPLAGTSPLSVHFDGTGAQDPDGDTMSFAWTFGDGADGASTAVADHTYADAGTYTARLRVNDDGQPALVDPVAREFTITVRPPGAQNRAPDCAAATVTPDSGRAPLAVVLDATGCVDPDGDPLVISWYVPRSITTGDTFPQARAETTLTEPGNYAIRLRARDAAAESLEIDRAFTVTVAELQSEAIVGSCGGCTAPGGLPMVGVALALLWVRRSRRR